MNFEFPLIEERVKPHQVTALHLMCSIVFCLVGVLCILVYGFITLYHIPAILLKWTGATLLVSGILIFILSVFKNKWLTRPNPNRVFRIIEWVFALTLCASSASQKLWVPTAMFGILAAALLFALYWEGTNAQTLYIRVDSEGVKLPVTSRSRLIIWPEIEQVLFRFGTLTIDCLDNRLFQWNISQVNFDKEEFEIFCQQQIELSKANRDANNW